MVFKPGASAIWTAFRARLLKTGQTTQYNSELDDGYYEKGFAKAYEILTAGQFSGTVNVDLIHLTNAGISFDSGTKEIRAAGLMGIFVAGGGETIVVTGSTSNDGTYTTASADANKIVVNEALADEAAGATVSIAKRESHSNNCVLDLMTGLMWMRYGSYSPGKMGDAGDGKMPWTGQLWDIFQYCAACNTAEVGGYSDWRVSNAFELLSLANLAAPTGIPDSTAFASFPSGASDFWTSTTRPATTTAAITFVFNTTILFYYAKTTTDLYTMLVRGGI